MLGPIPLSRGARFIHQDVVELIDDDVRRLQKVTPIKSKLLILILWVEKAAEDALIDVLW